VRQQWRGAGAAALSAGRLADTQQQRKQRLESAFDRVEFAPGEVIVAEGEDGDAFYIIETGEARVTIKGREVAQMHSGMHFGEIALMSMKGSGIRTATVTASAPTVCLRITGDAFARFVRPNFARFARMTDTDNADEMAAALTNMLVPKRPQRADRLEIEHSGGARAKRHEDHEHGFAVQVAIAGAMVWGGAIVAWIIAMLAGWRPWSD